MSLIAARNFLAPFRSKVQIGALLVLAFLAFVFRYGAHSDSQPPSRQDPARVMNQERSASGSALTSLMAAQEAEMNEGAQRAPVRDQRLDDLMAGQGSQPAPQEEQPAEEDTRPKRLGDIARDLGLE